MSIDSETIKLILDMGGSSANVEEVRAKLETLDATAHKTAAATDVLKTSTINTGQAMLQSGRIIQDFAQGGIGGILNNVEGFTAALGLGSGLAGAATAVGVAFFLAYPHVKTFFQGVIDGSNKDPESADKLKKLTDALKDTSKELDELREKQSLTNTDLNRFNELTEKELDLEKKVAAAKKERKQQEELAALRPVTEEAQEKERAGELQARLGGDQAAVVAAVKLAIQTEFVEAEKAIKNAQQPGHTLENDPALKAAFERFQRIFDIEKKPEAATNLVAGAIVGGKESDVRTVAGLLPGGRMKQSFTDVLPETMRAEDAAAEKFDEDNQAAHDRRIKREAAAKKQKASNAAVEEAERDALEGVKEIEDAEAGDRRKSMTQFTHTARSVRTDQEKQAREAAAAQKQQQRQAAQQQIQNLRRKDEGLDEVAIHARRQTDLMVEDAKQRGGTPALMHEIVRQNEILQQNIEDQKRWNRQLQSRLQESPMQNNGA